MGRRYPNHIHVYLPIHAIPKPDGFFDPIVCIAVLEHMENPEEVIPEMNRPQKSITAESRSAARRIKRLDRAPAGHGHHSP